MMHEKLLEILDDQENLYKLHSAHGMVKTFRCLIMDQEVSLNQLEYKLTKGMQKNGGIMEQEGKDLSGNLEDFTEEQRSPVRNFDIALEDSAQNGLEKTTVKNPEGTIRENTVVERDGDSLEHDEINPSGSLTDCETVKTFRCLIMDQEVSLNQLEYKISGNLDDFAERFHSPVRNFDIALENTVGNEAGGMTVQKLENITGDNTSMETGGGLMEQEEKDLSGNLDDFAEELCFPVRNFDIALEDSAENILEKTTVMNPESTIEGNTGMKRNRGSLEHEKINCSGNLDDFVTVIEETTVRNLKSTIGENTSMEMSGSLLEHEEVNFSGNLDDFAEQFHSPVRNFDTALEDTVETIVEGTTVRNLVCKIQPTMDWMHE